MIRLSVNVLTSCLALLKRLDVYRFSSITELAYSKIAAICAEDLYNFSAKCGWVIESDSNLGLSERGSQLVAMYNKGLHSEMKCNMLMDYIIKAEPIWSKRIPYGRREATIFMSKDEQSCFLDAGLLSENPNEKVVEWWDIAAHQIRILADQEKKDTGRAGEINTIKYEKARTETEPLWMSVDSNMAGYDVKSIVTKGDTDPLLIEVKATYQSLDVASFYISSNEWRVAQTSLAYVFHLWSFCDDQKMLAVISPHEVLPYIPTNNLEGKWESARIPYACFKEKFVGIK